MIRDIARLAGQSFDAIVIGAGIYGLTIAWDLALRGVRVALIERGDFAAATSFNSLKTVHGGIRPLQYGAVAETRLFVRERRAIARMAPHLVRPLPFMIPTYRHPVRNRFVMAAFFAAYDRLAHDRNDSVAPSRMLPPSRTVGRSDALRLNPAIDPAGVTGGAIWHDYQLHSPERFAAALLHSMDRIGAVTVNYAEVRHILATSKRVRGVVAHDLETDARFEAHAPVVVNAGGPSAWRLTAAALGSSSPPAPRLSLAMNLVIDHPPLPNAVGGVARGRFLFMVPWRDRSIVGTSHDDHPGAPTNGGVAATRAALDTLVGDARQAFPRVALSAERIRLVHRGLLPAGAPGTLLKHSIVHDHAADGLTGLLTVVGVRYTTARATAERAADAVCALLERPGLHSRTAVTPLAGGDMADPPVFEREAIAGSSLSSALIERLVSMYGTAYKEIERNIEADPALGVPLACDCPVTCAEIVHSVRDEMAVHLTDALVRRTSAGAGGHPGQDAVAAAAEIMAAQCGWTPERRVEEIRAVDAFYQLHGIT